MSRWVWCWSCTTSPVSLLGWVFVCCVDGRGSCLESFLKLMWKLRAPTKPFQKASRIYKALGSGRDKRDLQFYRSFALLSFEKQPSRKCRLVLLYSLKSEIWKEKTQQWYRIKLSISSSALTLVGLKIFTHNADLRCKSFNGFTTY